MTQRQSERGLALISVLWALTLLSLIALTVISAARTEVKIAAYLLEEAKAEAIADGVANKAIYELLRPPMERDWSPDGQTRPFVFGEAHTTVVIRDELEKIDINNADENVLRALFMTTGIEEEEAQELADAIGDWRDPDDLARLNGAEARDYRVAGLEYEPSNAAFETVDEVQLVLGMSEDLFECIEPALTVYSGRSGISSTARNALVIKTVRRLAGDEGEYKPPAVPSRKASLMSLDGRAFEILVKVPMEQAAAFRRRVVVRITGDRQDPYWVYAWERWDETSQEENCQLS